MLISGYFRVFVTDEGDGVIAFIKNEILLKIIVPRNNTIAKEIFDKYHDQLSSFKYRYYAVAKWIVGDIRKAGYNFNSHPKDKTVFIPVIKYKPVIDQNERLSDQDKLYLFYYELERIKKKMSKRITLEN